MKSRVLFFGLLIALGAHALDSPVVASVSVSGASARSAKLTTGSKLLHCDVAAFYRVGDSAVVAATSDLPLAVNEKWQTDLDQNNLYIAFITTGGTGTCYIHNVSQ